MLQTIRYSLIYVEELDGLVRLARRI